MTMFFSTLKGLLGLAIAAFLALAAYGAYTALDSATSSYGASFEVALAESQAEVQRTA